MRTGNILGLCIAVLLLLCTPTKADFENDVLKLHNEYREKHGCPSLTLDSGLSAECKTYAEEIAGKDSMIHSTGPYGENLCYTTSDPTTCVKMWYDEIKDYDFDKPKYSPATGHFTQVIWKASKELGVGQAKSATGKNYVVARYKPAGNVEGMFKENVPRSNRFICSPEHILKTSKYISLYSWLFPVLVLQHFKLE
ncbi:Golgi-associated plant pathogenesis-related protein 1 isoform X1 [Drosophila virilis]|uniref:Golgi-associated plant pathogenesis-related protein 1 isoform X1 n=1 Tax=Drosophila virilis TaxID=7244 RepID=UPI001395E60D|nr:Golgi-associated plant pathogenesis-related protein 1 isoform X1 [Drosophila virilis]XP_032289837.1 Golgi-associated plant pathogenesis-related protein 1 isoform X1 [Drosophila virilis]